MEEIYCCGDNRNNGLNFSDLHLAKGTSQDDFKVCLRNGVCYIQLFDNV